MLLLYPLLTKSGSKSMAFETVKVENIKGKQAISIPRNMKIVCANSMACQPVPF